MSDTIKSFLDDGKLKTSALTVKLIKQIDELSYIITDKSMVAILDIHDNPTHGKYMQIGLWYKLIKCQRSDSSTIKTNTTFKPVKTQVKKDIEDTSAEAEKLALSLNAKASTKNYQNLETILKMPNHTKIDRLTVKVITKSRIISTDKGNYQICNIKDAQGDTTSLNLYSNYLNKLEQFKIYTIMNLRKGEVTKNEETKLRLHTTGYTKIEDGTMEDSVNFKDIGNADETITGMVIGIGEITFYQSCKLHYKKLDEDLKCPTCDKDLEGDAILQDFRSEIYIEADSGDSEETDVKEITFFKKALDKSLRFTQDNAEKKLNELPGKTAKVDYNIDEASRFIAVSLKLIQ